MARWISTIWTRQLIRTAEAQGTDAAPLWALAQLSPSDSDPMLRITEEAHLRLWSEVMHRLADPAFPIDYAARMQPDDYDALGLACKTAESVAVALDRIVRYLKIWTNGVELGMQRSSGTCRISVARAGHPGPMDVGYRAAMESGLAEVLQAIRGLTGRPIPATRVEVAHPAPPGDLSRHREFFGVDPEFECDAYVLELEEAVLALPLALADAGLSAFLLKHLDNLVQARESAPPFEEQVADAISRELPSGFPRASRIALRIGTSERTLQRQLARSGKSFQEVVADTRRTLATRLLLDTRHSLAEISFLLGFSEPSAFHRAFKRWTGQTPSEYRDARSNALS